MRCSAAKSVSRGGRTVQSETEGQRVLSAKQFWEIKEVITMKNLFKMLSNVMTQNYLLLRGDLSEKDYVEIVSSLREL